MKTVIIQMSDTRAREWESVLRDKIKRDTGITAKADTSLERLIELTILRDVANELTQQVFDAEQSEK